MPLPDQLPEQFGSLPEDIVHGQRYVQNQKLGSGNFGTAYLVLDRQPKEGEEQYKVLKRIHVGNLEPGETVDAKKEASLLSQLHHDNIVQFHDSFFDGNYFCIVTEFCDGGDMDMRLQEYKKQNEYVKENQVCDWLQQLLKALRYLHNKRILHRDLKAKNIFLKANRIKLGDFGISRILMGTADMASTFVGTPYYMSPEVIKHDKYDDKSDIWSLGCILYEICSLKHAFDGQSLMAVMYKIVTGEIPELAEIYSRGLNNILGKMLAREQDQRSSAKELLQHHIFKSESKRNEKPASALTPKERLRLKKQKEADERIRKLREVAEKTRQENENRRRESASRNFHRTSIENPVTENVRTELQRKKMPTISDPGRDFPSHSKPFKREAGNSVAGTAISKPSSSYAKPSSRNAILTTEDEIDVFDDDDDGTLKAPGGNTYFAEEYVDTALAKAISYSENGAIPEDVELAETVYGLVDDFEDSDIDDFDFSDDNIHLSDTEYKEMLSHLQDAFDLDDSTIQPRSRKKEEKSDKPVQNSAMTNNIVSSQITSMRKTCMREMGEEVFHKAYSYLRGVWSNNLMPSAPDYSLVMQKLQDIVRDDKKCFLLEQLIYLENEKALQD